MRTVLLLASLLAPTASAIGSVHVCCGCGADSALGTSWADAFNTLPRAIALALASGVPDINLAGTCALDRTLVLDASHSKLAFHGVLGVADAPPSISGGTAVDASAFVPVTDPAVLARLPPSSAGRVLQLNLTAVGVTDLGALTCRPYEGTDAGILPTDILPTGLELFWQGDPGSSPLAGPLELARYPNRDVHPTNWTKFTKVMSPTPPAVAVVDAATAARLASWAVEFARDPTSVLIHYNNPIGWADLHLPLLAINASGGSVTVGSCETGSSNYNTIEAGAYMYAYNLLPELDAEGEYVVDRVAGMLYVYPPSGPVSPIWTYAPWGSPVQPPEGAGKTAGAPPGAPPAPSAPPAVVTAWDGDLLRFLGTSFLSFEGITFAYARGIGVNLINSTDISFVNCTIADVGAMAVNISASTGVTLQSVLVRGAGNGGVYSYAGDRTTLTPSSNALSASAISYNNRYMFCYVPLLALGGVGFEAVSSELWGHAHMGIYVSGNDHSISLNYVHDVVQTVRDSGALYTGRDWTYRGTRIMNNTFARVNTLFSGDDVSAVYLDDFASGFIVTGNLFINVSRALLLGGGRDNLFADNVVQHADGTDAAVHIDARGEGWASKGCSAGGLPYEFLFRVPFNTSAVWIAAYPSLPGILQDNPCLPKYNAFNDNTICDAAGLPWIDVPNTTIVAWGSSAEGNVVTTC